MTNKSILINNNHPLLISCRPNSISITLFPPFKGGTLCFPTQYRSNNCHGMFVGKGTVSNGHISNGFDEGCLQELNLWSQICHRTFMYALEKPTDLSHFILHYWVIKGTIPPFHWEIEIWKPSYSDRRGYNALTTNRIADPIIWVWKAWAIEHNLYQSWHLMPLFYAPHLLVVCLVSFLDKQKVYKAKALYYIKKNTRFLGCLSLNTK